MEVLFRGNLSAVRSIESNDGVILVFHPDSSKEFSVSGSFFGHNVENQTAHIAEEFFSLRLEIIVIPVEGFSVDDDELRESVREIAHAENLGEGILESGSETGLRQQRPSSDAAVQVELCQEVHVAFGNYT